MAPPTASRYSFLLLLSLLSLALGQEPTASPSPEAEPALSLLEERVKALQDAQLPEATKTVALGHYQQARTLLGQAAVNAKSAGQFEALTLGASAVLVSIRQELSRAPVDPVAVAPIDSTVAELEQRLREAEASHSALTRELEQLKGESKRRESRRDELNTLLADERKRLTKAAEDLGVNPPAGEAAEVSSASRFETLSQRLDATQAIRTAEAELRSYDARNELLPARKDQSQRRVLQAQKLVRAWQEQVEKRRRKEAEDQATRAREQQREVARSLPAVKAIADSNLALAQRRTGEQGLTSKIEEINRLLAKTTRSLARLREQFQKARSRERAAGLSEAMGVLLRKQYGELPSPSDLRDRNRSAQRLVSRIELELIQLEEDRAKAGDIELQLKDILVRKLGQSDPEVEVVAREILTSRRDLLDALIADSKHLFAKALDLDTKSLELSHATEEYRAYVEKRILWIKSVAGGVFPSPGASSEAVAWLFGPRGWLEATRVASVRLLETPERFVVGLAIWVLAILTQIWARVVARRPRVAPDFRRTLGALLTTVGLAALIPVTLYGLGLLLALTPGQTDLGRVLGAGFQSAGFTSILVFALWCSLGSGGIGGELRWRVEGMQHVRRHLIWYGPVALATSFVVAAMERHELVNWSDGARTWNDSLGRGAFLLGILALCVFLQRVLQVSSPLFQATPGSTSGWVRRLRRAWYPLALLAPTTLGVLALLGYYYSALRLEACLAASLALVFGLVVCHGLLLRWSMLARRRVAHQQAQAAREKLAAAAPAPESPVAEVTASDTQEPTPASELEKDPPLGQGTGPEPSALEPVVDLDDVDLAAIRAQSGQLFRSMVGVSLILGLFFIWNDVLPALGRLEEVQLWPEIQMIDRSRTETFPKLETGVAATGAARTAIAPAEGEGNKPAPSLAPSPALIPGAGPSLSPPQSSGEEGLASSITLAHLALALIAFAFTLILARNLPGILELVLLERLPLDAGARYAVISVTRYVVIFVGLTISFRNIGIGWGSVQWLAAALTFGLAFGLQEIFANFVSGLILLAERPVRVGDMVTVNGINGWVQRIRIRATTILDRDGKELIIPNKDFVTGQVINWTLSEANTRMRVSVGVAYGSNTRKTKEVLLAVAGDHPSLLADPPPAALFMGFGDSTLDFQLQAWLPDPNRIPQVRDELLLAIEERFSSEEIQIAFPQRDLHIRSGELSVRLTGAKDPLTEKPDPEKPTRPVE